MSIGLTTVVQKLPSSINNAGRSIYAVNGKIPKLTLDFSEEYFRGGSGLNKFSDVVTHSRDSNATMVDSDGLIKWAPHNLVTYSEDFDTGWSAARATLTPNQTAPDGLTTAYLFEQDSGQTNHGLVYQNLNTSANTTFSVWAKKQNKDFVVIYTYSLGHKTWFDLSTGTVGTTNANHTATIESAGGGWYKCTVVTSSSGNRNGFFLADTDGSDVVTDSGGIYLWRPHTYRSDLGGMVDVPAGERVIPSASTYVPTTSAARYLPRVGHHVYNGSAWVNEGVLAESEARTNLITNSDFSGSISPSGVSITGGEISPSGISDASRITIDSSSGGHGVLSMVDFASGEQYTGSVYLKYVDWQYAFIKFNGLSFPGDPFVTVDLLNKTISEQSVDLDTATIEDVGNGWMRVSITDTASGSTSGFYILFSDSATGGWNPSFTGDGTSSILIYGAQVEAGPTPSSYIPTAGSTVTRAAETFLIPAANLPWPTETYGPELVTNGTFDTDISGWTNLVNASWDASGRLKIQDIGGTDGRARTNVTVTAGKKYLLEFDVYSIGNTLLFYGDRGAGTNDSGTLFITGSGSLSVARRESRVITFSQNNSSITLGAYLSDTTSYFDNVSVRELTRYPVSIQMNGRLTYADDELSRRLVRWVIDAYDYIQWDINTSSTREGHIYIQQKANNIADYILEPYLTPGILVPYNIASRHGMTFINGAVDGVALTEDTTPTNLPDLSATDLELAYDYMGTVETFRIWGVDLGDGGIENATTGEPASYLIWDQANDDYVQRIFQ